MGKNINTHGFIPEPDFNTEVEFNKAVSDNNWAVFGVNELQAFMTDFDNLVKKGEVSALTVDELTILEKAKKDLSQLILKVVVDKNGRQTKKWVEPIGAAEGDEGDHAEAMARHTHNVKVQRMPREKSFEHIKRHFGEEAEKHVRENHGKDGSAKPKFDASSDQEVAEHHNISYEEFKKLNSEEKTKLRNKFTDAINKKPKDGGQNHKDGDTISDDEADRLIDKYFQRVTRVENSDSARATKNLSIAFQKVHEAYPRMSDKMKAEADNVYNNISTWFDKDFVDKHKKPSGTQAKVGQDTPVTVESLGYTRSQIRKMTDATKKKIVDDKIDPKTVSILPDGSIHVIEPKGKSDAGQIDASDWSGSKLFREISKSDVLSKLFTDGKSYESFADAVGKRYKVSEKQWNHLLSKWENRSGKK